jgi:aromatic ring hydroxylase
MGARSGNNYLSALRKLKANLSLYGEQVGDPSIHPAFVKRARAVASLYDLQAEHPEAMTYRLEDGSRPGLSFIQPTNTAEVRKRGAMFRRWAAATAGAFLTPDRHNSALAAVAATHPLISGGFVFADNLRDYYLQARAWDWCCAASTDKPRLNRLRAKSSAEHIAVSGSLTVDSLAPFAEELLIIATTTANNSVASSEVVAFAISANARGVKLECNPDKPDSFEAVVTMDDALITLNRLFFRGGEEQWHRLVVESGVAIQALHYDVIRMLAEVEARRADQAAADVETARSLIITAEADAKQWSSGQFMPAKEPLDEALRLLAVLQ